MYTDAKSMDPSLFSHNNLLYSCDFLDLNFLSNCLSEGKKFRLKHHNKVFHMYKGLQTANPSGEAQIHVKH